MSRRTGQLLALIGITVLVVLAVWYQASQGGFQTRLLDPYGYYGFGPSGGGGSVSQPVAVSKRPQDFQANRPQSSRQVGAITELTYLVPFEQLVVLDGLQVPRFVPSFTTPVQWKADPDNYRAVVIDDENATRTAFLSTDREGELVFELEVENPGGQYVRVARYVFTVVSPLAFSADVNKDGVYDFQNDLVHLLRNWDSFGEDATRTLALVLSRLELEE